MPRFRLVLISVVLVSWPGWGCAAVPGPRPIMEGPCGGKRVPIETVLSRRACETRCRPSGPLRGVSSLLVLSAAHVAPGKEVQVRAVLRNQTSSAMTLPFVWHAGPMHRITALDARGRPLEIEGAPPPVGPGGYRPGPPYLVCLRLEPGGEAHVERTWRAVRWRFAASPRLPSGEPVIEPAGPLPAGRYQLRLQTMLQDPALGAPSAWIEIR